MCKCIPCPPIQKKVTTCRKISYTYSKHVQEYFLHMHKESKYVQEHFLHMQEGKTYMQEYFLHMQEENMCAGNISTHVGIFRAKK